MEEQKLMPQDGTYKYDNRTRQVSVSEEQLKKAGYVKLADDEQIVKKAVLSKEEAEWFEKYRRFPLFADDSTNFSREAFNKSREYRGDRYKQNDFLNRLSQAYFTSYTIEKEKMYYIKLGFDNRDCVGVYLNVNERTGNWLFGTRRETLFYKTKFSQTEIDGMQKDPRAKGLDLNVLKVEVPEDELED